MCYIYIQYINVCIFCELLYFGPQSITYLVSALSSAAGASASQCFCPCMDGSSAGHCRSQLLLIGETMGLFFSVAEPELKINNFGSATLFLTSCNWVANKITTTYRETKNTFAHLSVGSIRKIINIKILMKLSL